MGHHASTGSAQAKDTKTPRAGGSPAAAAALIGAVQGAPRRRPLPDALPAVVEGRHGGPEVVGDGVQCPACGHRDAEVSAAWADGDRIETACGACAAPLYVTARVSVTIATELLPPGGALDAARLRAAERAQDVPARRAAALKAMRAGVRVTLRKTGALGKTEDPLFPGVRAVADRRAALAGSTTVQPVAAGAGAGCVTAPGVRRGVKGGDVSDRNFIALPCGLEIDPDAIGPKAADGMPCGLGKDLELLFVSRTRGPVVWLENQGFETQGVMRRVLEQKPDPVWLRHPGRPEMLAGVRRFRPYWLCWPEWVWGIQVVDAREVDWLRVLVFGGYGHAGFAQALYDKLQAAEAKHHYGDGWMKPDWRDDLLRDLHRHVTKGDPLDVAAYCAFAHWHGWSVSDWGPDQ